MATNNSPLLALTTGALLLRGLEGRVSEASGGQDRAHGLAKPWEQLALPQSLGKSLPSIPSAQTQSFLWQGQGLCDLSVAHLPWQCLPAASALASLCRKLLRLPWPRSPGWRPRQAREMGPEVSGVLSH